MHISNRIAVSISLILSLVLSGCTTLMQQLTDQGMRRGASSSLVDYLYPNGETPPTFDETIPKLQVPLRVGIAFVPSYADDSITLNATHKSELLTMIKDNFYDKPFIREIVVIPETYMRTNRGFEGVDQVSRLYSLDVIALISYDQVVYTDDTRASILYWTIVGAYFINGSKNDVNTFVDVAVFDVNSYKLLLRAPGSNEVIAKSALINSSEKLRVARQKSFTEATIDMTANLQIELEIIKDKIKQDKSVQIAYRPGFSGGGGALSWLLLPLLVLFIYRYLRGKRVSERFNRYCQYTPDPRFD